MQNDISIYFSGHNIAPFAEVAIRSFLLQYPELKNNVVYFDDYSTDSTYELLESLGVKSMGWDTELKELFDNYMNDELIVTKGQSQMLRCEFILKSILKQNTSKYIVILDGDTVTMKRGFVEELMSSSHALIAKDGFMTCRTEHLTSNLRGFEKYRQLIEDLSPVFDEDLNYSYVKLSRAHPYHLCINTELLGNVEDFVLNLYDRDYINLFGIDCIDVGCDILESVRSHSLSYAISNVNDVHHWTWVSSSIRDSEHSCTLNNQYVLNRVSMAVVDNPLLREILKELDIKPSTLFKHHKKYIRTGVYN